MPSFPGHQRIYVQPPGTFHKNHDRTFQPVSRRKYRITFWTSYIPTFLSITAAIFVKSLQPMSLFSSQTLITGAIQMASTRQNLQMQTIYIVHLLYRKSDFSSKNSFRPITSSVLKSITVRNSFLICSHPTASASYRKASRHLS